MKPPAFQFYARDWLSSTLGMPWDAAGVYIHLLAWSWDNGPLPNSPKWRRQVLGPNAIRLWNVIKKRWVKEEKGWTNPRLEHQRKLQNAWSLHAKQAASIRWASREHMPKRSSASASASSKDLKPAAARPAPFRVYVAIASNVLKQTEDLDLDTGTLTEELKRAYARQGLEYDASIVAKAMDAAQTARARKRA